MSLLNLLWLAPVILLAYTAQAITGFGSTVISITLAAQFLPIPLVMPVVVALNLPFCAWLVWRERRDIALRLLWRDILPLMGLGTVVGVVAAAWLSGVDLRRPFGAVVIVIVALDLWRLAHRRENAPPLLLRRVLIGLSGFTQGLYAAGGPFLAAALAGSGLDKGAQRATLSVVWLLVNAALTLWFFLTGHFGPAAQLATLWLLPVTALALFLGNRLHHRVDERQFRLLVDLLLLISGIALWR